MRAVTTGAKAAAVFAMTLGAHAPARADQFHYHNVLIGTRAVGLGGAYGAVADDASGTYYNPAGLAFALSNDISGSANAYYQKTTTYKKTLGDDAFVEQSGGSVPSFFGGLQKLDRYVPGLVFAFGVYSTDSDLKDQDTLIENKQIRSTTIDRYHRTSNARANTYYAGAAAGIRLSPTFAVGAGLHYFNADELVQEYQDAKQSTPVSVNGEVVQGWRVLNSNVRERLIVHGVQPSLGMQVALPANVAVGLTLKKGIVASQQLQLSSETRTVTMDERGYEELKTSKSTTALVAENVVPAPGESPNSPNPIGDWPLEARLGTAWFASPNLMLTFDVTYHSAVTNAEKLKAMGGKAKYNKDAVVNYMTGVEYYVSPSFPLRFGLFTNNDARPEINEGTPDVAQNLTCDRNMEWRDKYCGQPDHIDYIGGTLFIGWVQPNSQIAAGLVLQQGEGKAQKLGDHQVQDVSASSYTFAFSATHNL